MNCPVCRKPVEPVAAALTKKIVGPDAAEVRCLACLAAKFKTTEARLLDAARRYRDGGCTMFRGLDLQPADGTAAEQARSQSQT